MAAARRAARPNVEAVLLDLDGTLYVGDAPIPGAVDAVRALVAREIPRRYLTNTTRIARRDVAARLAALGFPVTGDQLFTPALAGARWLAEQGVRRVALYVPEGAYEDFAGFERTETAPEAVVIGDLGEGWDFATLNRAFRQVMDGALLLALQKNRYWLTSEGITLDAGPFVAALEYASGREAMVVGKPSAAFFELAAASLGCGKEHIAVVGDDVEADVAGAQAVGMTGVLVRTGKFREEQLRRSGIAPNFVLDSVASLGELF